MRHLILWLPLLGAAVLSVLYAQPVAQDAAARPIEATEAAQPEIPLDPAAATATYLAQVPADQRTAADAYASGSHWITLWSTLITVVLMVALLHRGWSRAIRDRTERISRRPFVQTAACFAVFHVLVTLALLPWWAFAGWARERQHNFTDRTFFAWVADHITAAGVELVILGAAVVGFYAIVRAVPRTWTLWGAIAGVLFSAFVTLIHPVYVAPLFNTFTPLADERMRAPILAMARAHGIDATDVYVMDESRRSNRINAHVAGLFGTQRIALNDNLLNRASLPEIKTVMAHEIGHYVLNHHHEQLFRSIVFITTAFLLLRLGFDRSVRRWGARWGVRSIGDVAGLPLLVLLFTVLSSVGTPLANTFSRQDEAEADAFALDAAREPDGTALVLLKIGEFRKLDPSPLEVVLFLPHPSPRDRIYRAMVWKAAQSRDANTP